ncbi:MAG: ribonuclease HI family protein [Planctomycetes bacterium]|nr:ribonuclease HI family protein [Planctomycetota bacterium]
MPPNLIINIDGGSRGNPGPAATGLIIATPDGVEILTRGEFIGEATNNVAEYKALLSALKRAPDYLKTVAAPELEVRSDSELLVKQMKGEYRIKNAGLVPLAIEAKRLIKGFHKVKFVHVYREANERADKACNLAMNARGVVEDIG